MVCYSTWQLLKEKLAIQTNTFSSENGKYSLLVQTWLTQSWLFLLQKHHMSVMSHYIKLNKKILFTLIYTIIFNAWRLWILNMRFVNMKKCLKITMKILTCLLLFYFKLLKIISTVIHNCRSTVRRGWRAQIHHFDLFIIKFFGSCWCVLPFPYAHPNQRQREQEQYAQSHYLKKYIHV